MLNLYCVNMFKGEILEGQMYVTAATREEAVKLATERLDSVEGLDLIPVRMESDLKEVYPVNKEVLQKEYDTPKYEDGFILSDNYKVEIRKFKDDDDETGEVIDYDTLYSNSIILAASSAIGLFESLVRQGDIDENETNNVSIFVINTRTGYTEIIDTLKPNNYIE